MERALTWSIYISAPGDNLAQERWWTQLIFPVSGCGNNVLVRVWPNHFSALPADVFVKQTPKAQHSGPCRLLRCPKIASLRRRGSKCDFACKLREPTPPPTQ